MVAEVLDYLQSRRDALAETGTLPSVLSPEAVAALEQSLAEKRRHRQQLRGNGRRPNPPTDGQLEKLADTTEAVFAAAIANKADGLVSRLWMQAPAVVKRLRDATARLEVQANPLWAAPKDTASPGHPTALRQAKEPLPLVATEMAGGQLQHKPQVFEDVYGRHMTEPQREAVKLLRDAWEAVTSVRVTSSRPYTGVPFAGGVPADSHMSQTQREYVELASEWMAELSAVTPVWGQRIAEFILHIPDERTGRIRHVSELGAANSGYAPKTDGAMGAGVMAINDALIRALEALQTVLVKRQYRRIAKDGTLGPQKDTRRVAYQEAVARRQR